LRLARLGADMRNGITQQTPSLLWSAGKEILMRSVAVVVVCVALVALNSVAALAYTDGDSDKVEDEHDNCQGSANPLQFDIDADGKGDLCEQPIPISDAFKGTPGIDLVFGSFRDSVLSGGRGADALYGGPGNDILDGGAGRDFLIGGPGDDVMTGGPGCDVFGIHTAIEHRDVITDFSPLFDRLRFPPRARSAARDGLPSVEYGGSDHLEVIFRIEGAPDAAVVFEGIQPGTHVMLSTEPCGDQLPPVSVCPAFGAARTTIFVGFEAMFCPDSGELWKNTGVYHVARFGMDDLKAFGEKRNQHAIGLP